MENKKTSETLLLRDETESYMMQVHLHNAMWNGDPEGLPRRVAIVVSKGETAVGITLDYRQCLMLYKFLESYV